jgi:hydrogenase nickel incorporation protein HypA/HybF
MAVLQGAIVHEVGIAASILESVETEARRRPEARFAAVGVRIGELSNVDQDALAFAFEALTRKTPLEDLRLEVEWCPRRQKCLDCGKEFAVREFDLSCPQCGGNKTSCTGGTELDIAYLELEEPCVRS